MKKFKEILKINIEDETAAFTILGAMIITFSILIGSTEYINYSRLAEANADVAISQIKTENEINTEIKTEDIINTEKKDPIDEKEIKKKNEEEFEKLKKENKVSSQADIYYIKVNYGAQVVTVYKKDKNGKYTVPVKAMVCSTGRYTPTSGVYRTLGKGNWWPLMGDVYGQYSTHIMGDILFHSVPYLEAGDKSSLEYWAYDQLGQRVSLGCVRLTVADAKWIYNNCAIGTQVEFYSSSNPGPLGKPSTRKISSAPNNIRGWDPTDPDSKNPWGKYLKDLKKKNNKKDNGKKDNKTEDKDKTNTNNEDKNPNKNEVDEHKNEEIKNDTIVNEEINTNSTENTNTSDGMNLLENNIINAINEMQ